MVILVTIGLRWRDSSWKLVQHLDHLAILLFSLQTLTMDTIMQYGYSALDRGLIPDSVLRPVIRQLCRQRLREINKGKSLHFSSSYQSNPS
jgi:hypothetical protein